LGGMAISRREFFINSAKLATTSALIATGLISYSKYAYAIQQLPYARLAP